MNYKLHNYINIYEILNSSFLDLSILTYFSINLTFCFPIRISKTNHKASIYDSHVASRYKTDHRLVYMAYMVTRQIKVAMAI